jgi:sorting and assembly machinery component 37
MFPVPQKYYVPTRIRDSYHQRLLAAGLWKPFAEETPVDSPFPRDTTPAKNKKEDIKSNPTLSRAFEREKVCYE